MDSPPAEQMQCMEVWGGTKPVSRAVHMDGLNVWIYSKPFEEADNGGDIYYASTCATGRINRLLLADVCGHGRDVAGTAKGLRKLMSRYVNCLDQTTFVRSMNRQFTTDTPDGCFATAVVTTFFAPTNHLAICNAGHPPPLQYRAGADQWSAVAIDAADSDSPHDVPLGIFERAEYFQTVLKLEPGDVLLCYTDALSEARSNGELIGTEGLLQLVRTIGPGHPELVIDQLLGKIAALDGKNLERDDVTVMLMQPTARRKATVGDRLRGLGRLVRATVRGLNPRAERPPLPDLSVPNIGGALIAPLGQRYRPGAK